MKKAKSSPSPGRPRAFDPDQALESALQVFWQKGYEGASLSDLTQAMGINRPSLYAAFGNKEELFRKAMERYASGPVAYVRAALERPTARAVAEALLNGSVDMLGCREHPRGCFFVQGALACGEAADSIREDLASRRAAGEKAIRDRFQRAIQDGDLPAGTQAADLARFISATIAGMAVQAAGGATRTELEGVARLALRAWPT